MESLQVKIGELDRWRSIEKSVLSRILAVKTYDIRLHTLAMSECQELDSKFEEKARKNLSRMTKLYEKSMMSRDTFSDRR